MQLAYRLPDQYVNTEQPAAPAASATTVNEPAPRPELWKRIWEQKAAQAVILTLAIGFLTILFFFQNYLVRYPVLTRRLRDGFLLFTLVWIGWYAQAQLSIVTIIGAAKALVGNREFNFLLWDPPSLVLWGFVVVTLIIISAAAAHSQTR